MELVWDYRTGDIIDAETGEVVGRIYVATPSMAFEKRWSSEAPEIHYAPSRSPGRRRRGTKIVLYRSPSALREERAKLVEELAERARRLLPSDLVDTVVELYRRLEERGFSWIINGFLRKVSTRLAFLATLVLGRCDPRIPTAFGISYAHYRRLCREAQRFIRV